ncbi:MobQ family relaxase [uncultured Paracoccus sp.]|jgi:ATP-dependent exoDNAse (exonuclease V) alpha subunit|uniref:MobQ family relaxase n=1 Tax=uncultured Paracoccus sp. TaxID=189685 RepID=UPI0026373220|nr:MobQ family relaxase [uncultured Paracoccus sp.]
MAIYHLRATMISRSSGRSATAAAAYRVGERIEDHRTGLTFDYRARGGVDHVETLAPTHAPAWVQDRAALWNAVEAAETRKNSQVAREIRVALPAELDHGQRVELVREFCQREFVARGMVADIALHAPGREGDDRNHHAHILLTTREIGPEGFGAKNRDWNAVEMLEGWREAWARDSNRALERCGHEERIDHRTLEAQRIEAQERATAAHDRGDEAEALRQTVRAVELDRDPLPQLSAGAWQMKERGIEVAAVRVWREVKAQAVEVARVAEVLASQVRDWIGRAVDRLGPPAQGLAYADAADWNGRKGGQDLAERLREAWEARQSRTASDTVVAPGQTPEPESARSSLAERLREAAQGIDRGTLAEAAARLQEGREAEERQRLQEVERLKEQDRQQERLREREARDLDRDSGLSH